MSELQEQIRTSLVALVQGDRRAAASLAPVLYAELRRLAGSLMARLRPGQTLQATALVNEAYLKLVGEHDPGWEGRAHFFGAAARAMREILVDEARRKAAEKRGADWQRVTLDEGAVGGATAPVEVLDVHRALQRLEAEDPRKGEVVMLRYFAGLSIAEVAEVLGVGTATVEREWRFARAWLLSEIDAPPDAGVP